MSYKVEKQVFLNGEVQEVGAIVDVKDKDVASDLVSRGTLSESNGKPSQTANVAEVDTNTTTPLDEKVAQTPSLTSVQDGPQEQPAVLENQSSDTPEAPVSSSTNLHLG